MKDVRKCEVCGRVSEVYVVSSCLEAFPFAACEECIRHGAEPRGTVARTEMLCDGREGVKSCFLDGVMIYKDGEYTKWRDLPADEFADIEV